MKTYIYLIILIFLSSCSIFKNEIEKENNFWNESINEEKLNDIKTLLSPEIKENTEIISQSWEVISTWTEIFKQEKEIIPKPKKIEITQDTKKQENLSEVKKNYESWVLTPEEIEIIESTTDWEIDELIDLLFKDLE